VGDISAHFSRDEFKCSCCNQDTVDIELVTILEVVRNHFNQPVHINSGNRCLKYNRSLVDKDGNQISKDTSQHVLSKAADIRVENVKAELVYNFLTMRFPDKYGFGKYQNFTHIDCRSIKARW